MRSGRPCLIALAALVLGLASAPSADAARISFFTSRDDDRAMFRASVEYVAGKDEPNRLVVSFDDEDVHFRDDGARITWDQDTGCRPVNAHEVRCPIGIITDIAARLGDRDDTGILPNSRPRPVTMRGGDGNDRLTGGDEQRVDYVDSYDDVYGGEALYGNDGADLLIGKGGPDALYGGGGPDLLRGGKGADYLIGGGGTDRVYGSAGRDLLTGDAEGEAYRAPDMSAADVIDGGAGRDRVDYSERHEPVFVNLADPAPDGKKGEGDQLRAVENLTGGSGNDVLIGDSRANAIDGEAGTDKMSGRGGADRLDEEFESSRDILDGGAGPDYLEPNAVGPGESSSVTCGRGRDVVGFPSDDRVARDCEAIQLPDCELGAQPTNATRKRLLVFRVTCSPRAELGIRLSSAGQVIGRGSGAGRSRPDGSIRVTLSARGGRIVRRQGRIRVRVLARGSDRLTSYLTSFRE